MIKTNTPHHFNSHAEGMRQVATEVKGLILDKHAHKPLDFLLFGENHSSLGDKVVQSQLIEELAQPLGVKFYGIEWPAEDRTSEHFINDLPAFMNYNLRQSQYTWINDYNKHIRDNKTAIPLARVLSIQAAAQGLDVDTIDCRRSESYSREYEDYVWRINEKQIPESLQVLIDTNTTLRNMLGKYPSFNIPYRQLAGSETGMLIRDFMMADRLITQQSHLQLNPIIATVGLSHIIDNNYPNRPTLPEILSATGKNVTSVIFDYNSNKSLYKYMPDSSIVTISLPDIYTEKDSVLRKFADLLMKC